MRQGGGKILFVGTRKEKRTSQVRRFGGAFDSSLERMRPVRAKIGIRERKHVRSTLSPLLLHLERLRGIRRGSVRPSVARRISNALGRTELRLGKGKTLIK